MLKRLIVAAIIFGIASSAGLSIGIKSTFAADNAAIAENDRVVLHGNVTPRARPEFDVGPSDPSLPMNGLILLLKITPEKQAQLDRLVAEQQNPTSSNFHRWLTPQEFGTRFGRTPEEIATVKNWLVSYGFAIGSVANSRTMINFSGTAADVNLAFRANMHDYQVNGHLRHANSTDFSIPSALAGMVAGPVSLNTFPHKPAHTAPRPVPEAKLQPDDTLGGTYNLAPGDFTAVYDVNNVYSMGYKGAGVTIAILGQAPADTSSWSKFRSTFGLPANPPHVIVAYGYEPVDYGLGDKEESDLDVEWSGAVAPAATIDFVTANVYDGGVSLSAEYAVDNNLAPIISLSYEECEPDLGQTESALISSLWQQAASQGITVFVASGDTGAFDCLDSDGTTTLAVNGLASTPYNIAAGGTSLSDSSEYWNSKNGPDGVSALSYIPLIPEVAWNNWNSAGEWNEAASGGGASIYNITKPPWQVCPGVPNDNARDVPDVSLNADPYGVPYLVYTCNDENDTGTPCPSDTYGWWTFGGTSCATPTFAGIMALIVQSTQHQRQGLANTMLYQLANAQYTGASGASAVFNDITSGTNGFVGYDLDLPGYSCGVGYSQVTGLGSVDATNLLLAFQEREVLAVATFNIAGGVSSTTSRTVTLNNTTTATTGGPGPPTYYMASQSPTFAGATWQTYSAAPSFTLSAGNGSKTVYFKVKNAVSVSPKVSSTIVLAQLPTISSFKIDAGAASTVNPTVTLNNTATMSPTQYRASESESSIAGATWQTYSTAPKFTLSSVGGTHTVYFQVQNNVLGIQGQSAVSSKTIQLVVPPVLDSFQINNGATTTTTNRTVTLNNTTTGGTPTYYMASQSSTFAGAAWKPYSPAPYFTLSAGNGIKTVYFKVKNAAGVTNKNVLSASITLD